MKERKNETVNVLEIRNELNAFLVNGGIPASLADSFFEGFDIHPEDGKIEVTVAEDDKGKVKIDFSYRRRGFGYYSETGHVFTMRNVTGGITLDNNKKEYSGWMRPIENAWGIGYTLDEHYTAHLYKKGDEFIKDYESHSSSRRNMTDINYSADKGQLVFDDVGIQMKYTSDTEKAVLREANKLGAEKYYNFWGYFPSEKYHCETVRMDWRPDITGTYITRTQNRKTDNMAHFFMLRGENGSLANFNQSANPINEYKDIPKEEISEEELARMTKFDSKEQQEKFAKLYIHGRSR